MLVTDGSGHVDGDGGYAAHLIWTSRGEPGQAMGCATCTSVYRMEFTALLEGLTLLAHRHDLWSGRTQDAHRLRPLRVWWVGDNESLVNSVKRGPNGQPIYSRDSAPDLWGRFEFFERYMHVEAHHSGREAAIMKSVDWYASTLRVVIKNAREMYPWQEHRHA
jgi:hypothetical protein